MQPNGSRGARQRRCLVEKPLTLWRTCGISKNGRKLTIQEATNVEIFCRKPVEIDCSTWNIFAKHSGSVARQFLVLFLGTFHVERLQVHDSHFRLWQSHCPACVPTRARNSTGGSQNHQFSARSHSLPSLA